MRVSAQGDGQGCGVSVWGVRQGRDVPAPREHPLTGRSVCQCGGQVNASAAEGGPSHGETLSGSSLVDNPALLCTAGMEGEGTR